MLRWLLCCFVFLPLWDRLYDNVVLINSLGIPAGEWQRRHQRVAVVSLEGLLSGEQIFSRETKLVVLSCFGGFCCDVEWPNFLMDGLCHEWPSRDLFLFNLFLKKKEKRLPRSPSLNERGAFEKCKQKTRKTNDGLQFFTRSVEKTVGKKSHFVSAKPLWKWYFFGGAVCTGEK